ncbi:hypothetical protein [Pseudomonas fluorescens]|uniref:Uncharacterized protein n=1 Tax=Pseudomonas fluorescens TaxID=294 RepID=A0A423M5K1_PSEFL|nr:hypothetical protein [Pseudomonas fluorescens]RON77252.1 hypothetical protein BK670_26805 [Pseudomonas fluorescens]
MTLKIRAAMAVVALVMTNVVLANQDDVYFADSKNKFLNVTWANGSKKIEGVVGSEGENVRELVDFNGGKALHYENLASRSPFEAYFTLSRNENQILVDCIYASIRNEQNGILINKAVCGLSRPLVEGYEDTVYEFSDQWKSETASVSIAPVLKIPPMSLEVKEAEIGSAELFRIYKDKKDLSTSVPKVILRSGAGKYSFGSSLVFSVYNVGALTAPVYLDVSIDGLAKKFVRYDRGAVEKLF